jgi:hypothetical protein
MDNLLAKVDAEALIQKIKECRQLWYGGYSERDIARVIRKQFAEKGPHHADLGKAKKENVG